MSLEQYKNKNRGELWDVVVIQAEVIAELEKERDDLQECFDTCYDELGATRDAHDELEKDLREFEHAVRNENEWL